MASTQERDGTGIWIDPDVLGGKTSKPSGSTSYVRIKRLFVEIFSNGHTSLNWREKKDQDE